MSITANQIAYQRQVEEGRANLARERETNRSNLSNEALKRQELEEGARHNLVVEGETSRHNLATETETNRSNLAKELETSRHNVASEQLQGQQISSNLQLGLSQLRETVTHNRAQESLSKYQTDTTANTGRYSADQRYAGSTYTANTNREMTQIKEEGADRRAQLQADTNIATSTISSAGKMVGGLFGSFAKLINGR